ncbi:MAG TPA: hypothetical protein VGR78_15305 [Verrucomicrobiae bacterium]|jgi:hypothetical protein|nr:hypothetical protein [Verrucomicrobiae bacterium]
MKTFRELISWELEQDKRHNRSLLVSTEDAAGRLSSCVLRKLRYLSAASGASKASSAAKPI